MSESQRKSQDQPRRRAYNSARRAAQAAGTRERIRAAARECFLAHGFTNTRMRDVAERARVSEATLYLAFPTKAALLADVIRSAVRGPFPATRLVESPQWQTVVTAPTRELLPRFSVLIEGILHEVAPLLALGAAAASDDADLLERQDHGRLSERATFRTLVETLHRRRALAPQLTLEQATDIVYALASDAVYLRLTRDCAWSREQYVDWLADTLDQGLRRGARSAKSRTR